MNSDRAYARVRARQALAYLEGDLGPGIAEALVRSADLLRDDADLLDDLAEQATPDDDPAGAGASPSPSMGVPRSSAVSATIRVRIRSSARSSSTCRSGA